MLPDYLQLRHALSLEALLLGFRTDSSLPFTGGQGWRERRKKGKINRVEGRNGGEKNKGRKRGNHKERGIYNRKRYALLSRYYHVIIDCIMQYYRLITRFIWGRGTNVEMVEFIIIKIALLTSIISRDTENSHVYDRSKPAVTHNIKHH